MFSDTEAENDRETGRNRSQDRKTGGFFPKEATGEVDGKKGVDYNEKAKNPGKNGRNERRENGMTIQEKAEKAVDLKLHHGYNCTQAVTAALADDTDLTEGQLVHLAAGFCAGMGNMEATCGALIGAGMIAGASTEGKGTVKYTRALLERFKEMCGATICRELKTVTDGRPLCPCENCVRNAVLAYGEIVKG